MNEWNRKCVDAFRFELGEVECVVVGKRRHPAIAEFQAELNFKTQKSAINWGLNRHFGKCVGLAAFGFKKFWW